MDYKLKERRMELGLTLEQVGEICGVGKSTVRKWETGAINNMGRDKIVLLAKALKVSPLYVLNAESSDIILSISDIKLLSYTKKLTEIGKEKVIDYAKDISLNPLYSKSAVQAAHERTDIEVTKEMKDHDNKLMDDDSFWEE